MDGGSKTGGGCWRMLADAGGCWRMRASAVMDAVSGSSEGE